MDYAVFNNGASFAVFKRGVSFAVFNYGGSFLMNFYFGRLSYLELLIYDVDFGSIYRFLPIDDTAWEFNCFF